MSTILGISKLIISGFQIVRFKHSLKPSLAQAPGFSFWASVEINQQFSVVEGGVLTVSPAEPIAKELFQIEYPSPIMDLPVPVKELVIYLNEANQPKIFIGDYGEIDNPHNIQVVAFPPELAPNPD
jgi:hypothetical protein